MDTTKLKLFCRSKDTVNRTKWQPIDWEKIFSSYILDRVIIISKYINNSKKVDTNNKNISKMVYRAKQRMLNRGISNVHKISLVIKEMQIKTSLRFYLIPVRIAKIKNSNNSICW